MLSRARKSRIAIEYGSEKSAKCLGWRKTPSSTNIKYVQKIEFVKSEFQAA
jgi:hypothetical protein